MQCGSRLLLIGSLIAFASLGLVLLLLWAVVVVPPLLIDTRDIQDPAKRLDEINGLRTTLARVLGDERGARGSGLAHGGVRG